jgi:hypothetical protein
VPKNTIVSAPKGDPSLVSTTIRDAEERAKDQTSARDHSGGRVIRLGVASPRRESQCGIEGKRRVWSTCRGTWSDL